MAFDQGVQLGVRILCNFSPQDRQVGACRPTRLPGIWDAPFRRALLQFGQQEDSIGSWQIPRQADAVGRSRKSF